MQLAIISFCFSADESYTGSSPAGGPVGTSANVCWKTMFVNFKRPLIKRVRWMKHREIVKSITCRSTQFPFIWLTLLLRAILAKRVVCPLSVCRWKQSVISAATSDILVSNTCARPRFLQMQEER